ncbi:MAG TPA: hypothetical protein PLK76_04490 [bacterium]|nr:hypothetical protein [bacterium]
MKLKIEQKNMTLKNLEVKNMSIQKSRDILLEEMQLDLLETPEETAAKLKAAAAQEKVKKVKEARDKKWNIDRRKTLETDRASGKRPARTSDPEWYKKY